jgi:hypothetical protein
LEQLVSHQAVRLESPKRVQAAPWDGAHHREVVMSLTEKYPSRLVRCLLDFRRSLLYRTPTVSPADEAELQAAMLCLIANGEVYHESTPAASAGRMPVLGVTGT